MPILFPAYDNFNKYRANANNDVVALLIGSRIGAQRINNICNKSSRRMPDIFTDIEDIKKFNVTPDQAILEIQRSEHALVNMAIVQTLSVYEIFVKATARILLENGYTHSGITLANYEYAKIGVLTEFVRVNCKIRKADVNWQLYNYIREIRNSITHSLGEINTRTNYNSLSNKAQAEWEKLTLRPLSDAVEKGYLSLEVGELIAVLSIAHRAALRINSQLVKKIGKRYWAQMAVKDFEVRHPQYDIHKVPFRKVRTHASMFYGPIKLSDQVLKGAINKL